MVCQFPNFCKLDSNGKWVGNCGSSECSEKHNIRKNAVLLPQSHMDMNWLDFLDVFDCYRRQRIAACRICKRCWMCRLFKNLRAEAWGITLNSWHNVNSFVTAVRFDNADRDYPIFPMTVTFINRRTISEEEKKIYKGKEQKILYEKIINKYKRW